MDMKKMMKQARKMQEDMAKAQEELAMIEVSATAGGGMVDVVATCDMKIKSIKIAPEAIDPEDADMLQDTIVAAVNQAIKIAEERSSERMNSVTGGLSGGLGLPF